jgi:hypothetical protein
MDMNRLLLGIFWIYLLSASLPTALAQEDGWPRTLPVDEGLVTIYPLQVDGLDGDILRYRAALAWRPTAEAEPVFGAGWFESKVIIDQGSRVVYTLDLKVTETRFPEGGADLQPGLAAALATQAPGWNLDLSLDDLDAGLKTAEAEQESLRELNTAPPRIVYRDHPALLLALNGEPVLRDIENSPYKAVINTPYPLISDGRSFYLNAARDVWYRADKATGPYHFEASPPADIAAMVKPEDGAEAVETAAEPVTAANAPEIVVATEPTELIVTDGPAVFVPLVDDLLVLQNSDDDVFMHVGSQQYYIVLAGRWYRAGSLDGPWKFRAADQLPPAFASIPNNSPQADSRVYVAGTPEAEEAVLDAQVPQTTAVERGPADVEVDYDGEPAFAPVEGTELDYAANTGATVLRSDRRYYLVEDGVWYESATPNGPWEVATRRPDGVAAIAPTSPVYHVKYVYIYDSTPDVVYVGYTPGYFGSYVYSGTVVYGTGWHYRPWVSPWYYYPRPATWGLHVGYNPWGGWSFGLSWNWGWGWGPLYAGFYSGGYWHYDHYWHHRHYGYWRPHGYRPRPAPYARHGYPRDRYGHEAGYRDGRYGRQAGYRGDGNGHGAGHPRDSYARGGNNHARGDNPSRHQDQRDGIANARDVARAGQSKAPRHRTMPLDPSDLRLKARARDANAAAARDLLVADSRGNVYRRANRSADMSGWAAARSDSAKVVRHQTTPVRAAHPQSGNREVRQDRDVRAAEQRSRGDTALNTRRQAAAALSPATRQSDRRAAPRRDGQSPPAAAADASRPTLARRDENRSRQAVDRPATSRQRPGPRVQNSAPAQGQSPRISAPQRPQVTAQPRAPAQPAARNDHRSAPPAQRAPQGSRPTGGAQRGQGDRGAGRQGRKHQ